MVSHELCKNPTSSLCTSDSILCVITQDSRPRVWSITLRCLKAPILKPRSDKAHKKRSNLRLLELLDLLQCITAYLQIDRHNISAMLVLICIAISSHAAENRSSQPCRICSEDINNNKLSAKSKVDPASSISDIIIDWAVNVHPIHAGYEEEWWLHPLAGGQYTP